MGLLIRHGTIVTADARYRADLYAEGETVTRIGAGLDAPPDAEVVDATGKLIFPGFIDPHVHVHLPFMGTCAKDTHATASVAALVGGTTTYIEMCCPTRNDDAPAAYQLWKTKAAGNSACDYAFHMSVTRHDAATDAQLGEIVADGTASFKIYLAYQGSSGVDDGELYRILRLAKRLGAITVGHCENAVIVEHRQQELLALGRTGPEWHEPSRPEVVEAEGTNRFATFLEATGAAGCVAHVSCEPALERAVAARSRGVRLWIEAVVPHLLLDRAYAERPGVDGMKYIMSPPLRDRRNQKPLWDALAQGLIDTVATDHCPLDTAQKLRGADAFPLIPNGLAGIEDRVNLLWTYGVERGRLDLHRFVDAASTRPARLFGLFPRKGTIAVGSDADLVVYDPQWRGVVSARSQLCNSDYNPFEGFPVAGRPSVVTVRGRVQVRDGRFVGQPGRGRMLRREPAYF